MRTLSLFESLYFQVSMRKQSFDLSNPNTKMQSGCNRYMNHAKHAWIRCEFNTIYLCLYMWNDTCCCLCCAEWELGKVQVISRTHPHILGPGGFSPNSRRLTGQFLVLQNGTDQKNDLVSARSGLGSGVSMRRYARHRNHSCRELVWLTWNILKWAENLCIPTQTPYLYTLNMSHDKS